MFSGKTKISRKEDTEKSGKVFKLLTEEIQALTKKAIERLSGALGPTDKRLTSVGVLPTGSVDKSRQRIKYIW